jgi:hypothetical protein
MNSSSSSRINETYSKDPTDLVTFNEKVNLTKDQHEVLNIICNTYQISISEYLHCSWTKVHKAPTFLFSIRI